VWGVFATLRILKARRAAAEIAKQLAAASPGDVEAEALAGRMRSALAKLKTATGDKRDYLYARPWYVIIGPPGAGKTTALLKSGVQFPFADSALKGVGGTRNLDFWFADDAVLIDTAGRYTTQTSDAAVDHKGWDSFLKLLRRTRPLQPINGVLVAIGLDELLNCDRAGLDDHAAAVRRRLLELRRALEVSAPVYVLFTKADLLAGFGEFFDDLDVEGRRAILGATLPLDTPTSLEAVLAEFDAVVQALADRVAKRLQEETDPHRRSLILGFPSQIASLRARLSRFLDGALLAEKDAPPLFRGFYLTSGVQEGAPLDRILGDVAAVYDAPPFRVRRRAARAAGPISSTGCSRKWSSPRPAWCRATRGPRAASHGADRRRGRRRALSLLIACCGASASSGTGRCRTNSWSARRTSAPRCARPASTWSRCARAIRTWSRRCR
jgi:type VI secretion system protein ImpL